MNLQECITYYKNRPAHILQDPDARHFWATFPDQPQLSAQDARLLETAMNQHNALQLFTFLGYYRHAQQTGEKLYGGWEARAVEPIGALLDRLNGENWR